MVVAEMVSCCWFAEAEEEQQESGDGYPHEQ
jgi:hypothetical protein